MLLVLIGVGLIGSVLWDALETVLLPRRVVSRNRLTSLFYRLTWAPWSGIGRRIHTTHTQEQFLWLYGPLSVLMLLGVWACGLIIGFAFLRKAVGDGSIWHSLNLSASTFFSVGGGDTPDDTLMRVLTVIEGGSGFSFLALVISYLPTFYQAFSRRESSISLLDARAGSPPSAVEFLRRHYQDGELINADEFFLEWEHWAAELLESHLSYPVLGFFRSQHDNESWLAALTMILDVSTLVTAVCDGPITHRANMTFAMARHAAVDLSQVYNTAPRQSRNDRLLAKAFEELHDLLGDSTRLDEAKFAELHALYEPYVTALSDYLLMPLPAWTVAARDAHDNWQTTAWSQLDGAVPEQRTVKH